ncbi:MAG: Cna B-type domain-containing protein [Clostridia bacterium]|nr:Cna B-type domain-containing protein [Clostridia bacterium]
MYRYRNLILMIACITLLSFMGIAVFAQQSAGIELNVVDSEGVAVSNAVFRIYKAATAVQNQNGYDFTWDTDFALNGMNINNLSDAYLPVHLAVYAQSRDIGYTEVTTDADGNIVIEDLSLGAYLIIPVSVPDGYIPPSPFVVTLPMRGASDGEWSFYVNASPKVEADRQEPEKTYISVKKEWYTFNTHPNNVKTVLLKDGEIVDSIVLSAENNWYFKWEDLDKNHCWNVIETDVPKGYEVAYDISEMTVMVKNIEINPDDNPPNNPSDDSTNGTTKPDKDTTPPDQLIQTGQLRWPIPFLAITGLLIFSSGWAMLYIGKEG